MGARPVPGHADACDAPSMAAPLYSSHTREVALDTVAAPLLDAIRAEAARNSLSLDGARAWSTHRDNRPATSFLGKLLARRSNPVDPDAEHDMVLVLQSTHLLFATHGVLGGTRAMCLPLVQATVSRGAVGAHLPRLDVPADDGITLSGSRASSGDRAPFSSAWAAPRATTASRPSKRQCGARRTRADKPRLQSQSRSETSALITACALGPSAACSSSRTARAIHS